MARPRKNPADQAPNPAAPPAPAEPEPKAAAAAFNRLADERKALSADDIKPQVVEIRTAVKDVRAALPRLSSLRDAVAAELPRHPIQYLDHLDDYAQAAWFADWLVVAGSSASEAPTALVEEARNLRKTMLTAAEPLALKGLIEPAKLQSVRSGAGHEDLAADLIELAALYEEAWPRVKNKTVMEREELERASTLGRQLQGVLLIRKSDAAKASPEALADQRARAYTLLVRAYTEAARAAAYLRYHQGDADDYAPAIFKAKRVRGAKGETTAPPPVAVEDDLSKSDEAPPI